MKVRDKQRRYHTTNNAFGIDCVEFMSYAASFRWREVETWFPDDPETDRQTLLEIRALPTQDETVSLFGTCGGRPDEIAMERERVESMGEAKAIAQRLGIDLAAAEALLKIAKKHLEEENRKDNERVARLKRWHRWLTRKTDADELVPLDDNFQEPDQDLVAVMAKARRKALREKQAIDST